MDVVIAYSSKFGNGKRCVNELKGLLEDDGLKVKVFSIAETKPEKLPEAGLYVFSSPVRQFMLPRETRTFLKGFIPQQKGARYALMTTHGLAKPLAFKKMKRLLKRKGLKHVTNDFNAKVVGAEGPLEDGYSKKIESFAKEISSL